MAWTKSCWLTLGVTSYATVHTIVYRFNAETDEPIESDTETSVRKVCPIARKVTKKLLNRLDDEQPGWRESDVTPTE